MLHIHYVLSATEIFKFCTCLKLFVSQSRYLSTAWKVSEYEVFSGPYFPVFGLNAEIYTVNLRISPNTGKYGQEKTPYLDIFHAVALAVFFLVW